MLLCSCIILQWDVTVSTTVACERVVWELDVFGFMLQTTEVSTGSYGTKIVTSGRDK